MKRWRDIPRRERWMLVLIALLLLAVLSRWAAVGEGIGRGFRWFFEERTQTEVDE